MPEWAVSTEGSPAMALIYLSSTVDDLRVHRASVVDALRRRRHVVLGPASFAALERRDRYRSLRAVADSERYVGIIGWRYGFVPEHDNPDRLSITELEFREADRLALPRTVFMASEDSPLRSIGDDDPTAIRRFRVHVGRDVVMFKDEADLRQQLERLTDPPRQQDDVPPPSVARERHRVFISYSHRDARWCDRVGVHLRALQHQVLIDPWSDHRIQAGAQWRPEIEHAMASAGIAVLVVSADFLESSFIKEVELPRLLEGAGKGECPIMMVVAGPCGVDVHPALREYQAVNAPDRPLSVMGDGEQEAVLDQLARAVSRHIAGSP